MPANITWYDQHLQHQSQQDFQAGIMQSHPDDVQPRYMALLEQVIHLPVTMDLKIQNL